MIQDECVHHLQHITCIPGQFLPFPSTVFFERIDTQAIELLQDLCHETLAQPSVLFLVAVAFEKSGSGIKELETAGLDLLVMDFYCL